MENICCVSRMNTVSIIIPTYNEDGTVGKLLNKLLGADTLGLNKEVIIVDDGSTDETAKIIETFSKTVQAGNDAHFTFQSICLDRNTGKTSAILRGIIQSTGDIVIIQDADLEYDPADLPLLISPFLEHHADVVYGSRFVGSEAKRILYFWHTVGNKVLTLISNMCSNLNLTDMETGYKAFRGDLIRAIAPYIRSRRFGFEPEITARIAKYPHLHIFEVGIRYWGRTYQEGKKIGWRDGFKALAQVAIYNLFTKKTPL